MSLLLTAPPFKERFARTVFPLLSLLVVLSVSTVAAINEQMVLLVAVSIAGVGLLWVMEDPRLKFLSVLGIILFLQFAPPDYGGTTYRDYIGGIVFMYGVLHTLVKRRIFQALPLSPSPLYYGFLLFLAWSASIGIMGVILGDVAFVNWFRELLQLSPFLILPVCYGEIMEKGYDEERFLVQCFLVLWVVVLILEIVQIRNNISQAVYLYQIGHARFDITIGALMMFVFLSAAMTLRDKKTSYLVVGFILAFITLVLTISRTSWVGGILGIPLVILLGTKEERRRGYRFLILVLLWGGILLFLCQLFIPWVKVGLLFITQKFVGATIGVAGSVKSDLSFFNRIIEWRAVTAAIADAPITGYGLGGVYMNYNWLLGISHPYGYTHNGYLNILLKGGVVGTILMFIPYLGYVIKGLSYFYRRLLTSKERTYIRAGIVTIIFISFMGNTGSIFFQRELAVHIPLFWCYCIHLERKVRDRKRLSAMLMEGDHDRPT